MLVQTGKKSEYMGVFFRNANAMSPVIRYINTNQALFSYITTGGQIEAYFMFKGSPCDIIGMYQNIIGKTTLSPFWALGWHASAYAYDTQTKIEENI
jgi:alpha-glucosidase